MENGIKIDTGKTKAIKFTRSRVNNPLEYSLDDKKISRSEQL